jgi:hypothetical protein
LTVGLPARVLESPDAVSIIRVRTVSTLHGPEAALVDGVLYVVRAKSARETGARVKRISAGIHASTV